MIKYLFIVAFVLSCSNLSKNTAKNSDFYIKGGIAKNKTWNSSLKFQRYTWFSGFTMVYDLLLTKVDEKSPFYQWFSLGEKQLMRSCSTSYVALTYAFDSSKISPNMFFNQVKRAGFERIALVTFKSYIKNHPDYERNSFKLYDLYALCRKNNLKRDLFISFPNHKRLKIR